MHAILLQFILFYYCHEFYYSRFCGTVDILESHVLTCSGSGELSTDELGLPQPQFCSQCGASLCDSEALQAHMSIHSDYKCLK